MTTICTNGANFIRVDAFSCQTRFDSFEFYFEVLFDNIRKMNISLSLPKAKKHCPGNVHVNPFPVNEISNEWDRRQFIGIFSGMSVEVFDVNDIRELYQNGCYGSVTHIKVQPNLSVLTSSKGSLFATKSQINTKKELGRKLGNQNPSNVTLRVLDDEVVQESTGEVNFVTETDPFPLEESLVLFLEEAFFLQQSLRCLKIVDFALNSELSTDDFLGVCSTLNKNFVLHFVVYHYYRSKGWIVKSGLKFGGDFRKNTENW